jgi:hypothetical protein
MNAIRSDRFNRRAKNDKGMNELEAKRRCEMMGVRDEDLRR